MRRAGDTNGFCPICGSMALSRAELLRHLTGSAMTCSPATRAAGRDDRRAVAAGRARRRAIHRRELGEDDAREEDGRGGVAAHGARQGRQQGVSRCAGAHGRPGTRREGQGGGARHRPAGSSEHPQGGEGGQAARHVTGRPGAAQPARAGRRQGEGARGRPGRTVRQGHRPHGRRHAGRLEGVRGGGRQRRLRRADRPHQGVAARGSDPVGRDAPHPQAPGRVRRVGEEGPPPPAAGIRAARP